MIGKDMPQLWARGQKGIGVSQRKDAQGIEAGTPVIFLFDKEWDE
ncbi:hypothetical protein [Desulfonema magnum]|uniref:Uncharacterized protein n=1 Tax=Desulfonema magnum TaxID=45655 RepID=A0A975BKI6_9BACT|nr:hypothetical protein [Desulfonema magnum]QTA86754.1 Uncharacterized protein dnm_027780 [Desulfonema magnum]